MPELVFVEHKPSDGNYLAFMTKAEIREFAETRMMPLDYLLRAAKRLRKKLAREAFERRSGRRQ